MILSSIQGLIVSSSILGYYHHPIPLQWWRMSPEDTKNGADDQEDRGGE
jgi:hypothetical protein